MNKLFFTYHTDKEDINKYIHKGNEREVQAMNQQASEFKTGQTWAKQIQRRVEETAHLHDSCLRG